MKNLGLFLLRVAVGAVFIYHGWLKLSDIALTTTFFDSVGIPIPVFFAWLVGLVEFVGGIALVLGVWVHTFALLLAVNMLVALLVVHLGAPWSAAELPVVLFGAMVALMGVGAGDWRLVKKECVCQMRGKKA